MDDARPAPRKKVLIVLNTMVCGGIEKSALTLFEAIPRERFEITLLLVHKTGEFFGLVPDWVKVAEAPLRPEDRYELLAGRRAALRQALRAGNLFRAFHLAAKMNAKLPGLPKPATCFPHFLDAKSYAEKARVGKGFPDGYRGTRILSVGRLCAQKGFDLAVAVLVRLIQAGYDLRWYVIGVGDGEQKLREAAAAAGLGERFCLLGVQTNPYPFFAGCDLYVQPSRYEGYCLTVAEARACAKPIVCTDFAGAREQIADGCTGLIVPYDEDRIYQAVKRLLDEPELRETLSRNLRQTTVDTTPVIGRPVALMEG